MYYFIFNKHISIKLTLFSDPLFLSNNFNNTFFFLILSTVLGILMLSLSFFFNRQNLRNFNKISEYECGFEPFDSATRQPFTIHFYIVGILFLIFDVEIALLIPWSVLVYEVSWNGFFLILFFISILILGFLYELKIKASNWDSL